MKSKEITTDKTKPINLLIEGDNYHSLAVLNFTHKNKIDVIYIDPPYNTGNKDFIFNDDYVDRDDPWRHSKWLTFMEKRLRLAHDLLKNTGVIFVSIDDNEVAQLRLLMDEIFGDRNFITQFVWEKTQHFGRQKINYYSNCEYVLAYAKKLYGKNKLKELLVEKIKSDFEDAPLYNASNRENKLIFPTGKVIFNIKDGVYTKTTDNKYRLLSKVEVRNGRNKNPLILSFKSRWSQATVDKEIAKGAKFWVKSTNFAIRVIYGEGKTFKDSPKQIIFTNKNNPFVATDRFGNKVGTTEDGSSELEDIIGKQNIFDYPKPTSLIKYLISLYFDESEDRHKKDFIILDFFAGTGTTGHAVLDLNKEDGGNRQFILCTNNENKICTDICYPRIARVIKGYTNTKKERIEGLGGNLKYLKTAFVGAQPTDKNKRDLVNNSAEMICIKENIFDLVEEQDLDFKIYKKNNKYLGIVFNEDAIEDFKKAANKYKGEFIIYCFSYTEVPPEREFVDLKNKHRLEPIPEVILKVYREIFKK